MSRSNFKQAKKKCVNAAETIKRDRFAEACLNGDKDMFGELKKLKGKHKNVSTKIDGKNSPEEIADHFGEIKFFLSSPKLVGKNYKNCNK